MSSTLARATALIPTCTTLDTVATQAALLTQCQATDVAALGLNLKNITADDEDFLIKDFLVTEIMAAKLQLAEDAKGPKGSGADVAVMLEAKRLVGAKDMATDFVTKATQKMPVNESPPVVTAPLSPSEWKKFDAEAAKMSSEFRVRRSLLLTRLNASIDSFLWSDSAVKSQDLVKEVLVNPALSSHPFDPVAAAEVMTEGIDVCYVAKVCSRPPSTRKAVNPLTKTKVGRVPDRGGRPNEQAAPPPEMPSWQKRQAPPPGGGGRGRGGGGGYRGNRGGGGGYQGGGYQGGGGNRGGGGYQGGGGDSYQSGGDDRGHRGSGGGHRGGGHRGGGGRDRNRGERGGGRVQNARW